MADRNAKSPELEDWSESWKKNNSTSKRLGYNKSERVNRQYAEDWEAKSQKYFYS